MSIEKPLLIVIPCLDEALHLPALLDQFLAEHPDALIVVADGGSTDGSQAIVLKRGEKAPNLVLLDNPRRLQAAGVNLAVRTFGSEYKWLLRIDAHCDYPAGFGHGLLDAAATRDAASVVVPMVSRGKTCFQIAAATAQNSRLGTGGSPHRHIGRARYVDHGHHALIRLDAFHAVGGYREDMDANEDAEFDIRLTRGGFKLWLQPGQAVTYYPRSTPRALWRQYYRYGRGRARTLRLHRATPKLRQLAPVGVVAAVAAAVLLPVTPWFAAPAIGWIMLTLIGGVIIGLRSGTRCGFLSGVAASIMHLAWGLGFIASTVRGVLEPTAFGSHGSGLV